MKTFLDIKITFKNLVFLTHFNKLRWLYIDFNIFKQWEFAIIIYHVRNDFSNDIIFTKTLIKFIIFLNKYLNEIKKNY